jgi:hypothetical protein
MNMTEYDIQTVFLRPGTVVTYLVNGVKVTEVLQEEVEVDLVAGLQGTVSIVKWPAAPGGEATAVEPTLS